METVKTFKVDKKVITIIGRGSSKDKLLYTAYIDKKRINRTFKNMEEAIVISKHMIGLNKV